jgi:stage III sporulation protein AD
MKDIFIIAGTGIISTAIIILLKQYRPEFAFGVALSAGIIILFTVTGFIFDIFEYISELISISGIDNGKYEILFRCFGICLITKIASVTCKDCGQTSISSKIELAGKSVILITSFPLFSEIIEIIKNLTEL